jgi:glutathione peroxidase
MIFKMMVLSSLLLAPLASRAESPKNFFDLEATTTEGRAQKFDAYKGKVVVVANTASGCGYTPQYKNLQALNAKYGSKGLVVLGFPSNDFGGQEPGTNKEIKKFCELNYKVDFQIFAKAPVSGDGIQPVFKWLVENRPKDLTGPVEWNFEKFIISKDGRLLKRFRSKVSPEDPSVIAVIESELKPTASAHK